MKKTRGKRSRNPDPRTGPSKVSSGFVITKGAERPSWKHSQPPSQIGGTYSHCLARFDDDVSTIGSCASDLDSVRSKWSAPMDPPDKHHEPEPRHIEAIQRPDPPVATQRQQGQFRQQAQGLEPPGGHEDLQASFDKLRLRLHGEKGSQAAARAATTESGQPQQHQAQTYAGKNGTRHHSPVPTRTKVAPGRHNFPKSFSARSIGEEPNVPSFLHRQTSAPVQQSVAPHLLHRHASGPVQLTAHSSPVPINQEAAIRHPEQRPRPMQMPLPSVPFADETSIYSHSTNMNQYPARNAMPNGAHLPQNTSVYSANLARQNGGQLSPQRVRNMAGPTLQAAPNQFHLDDASNYSRSGPGPQLGQFRSHSDRRLPNNASNQPTPHAQMARHGQPSQNQFHPANMQAHSPYAPRNQFSEFRSHSDRNFLDNSQHQQHGPLPHMNHYSQNTQAQFHLANKQPISPHSPRNHTGQFRPQSDRNLLNNNQNLPVQLSPRYVQTPGEANVHAPHSPGPGFNQFRSQSARNHGSVGSAGGAIPGAGCPHNANSSVSPTGNHAVSPTFVPTSPQKAMNGAPASSEVVHLTPPLSAAQILNNIPRTASAPELATLNSDDIPQNNALNGTSRGPTDTAKDVSEAGNKKQEDIVNNDFFEQEAKVADEGHTTGVIDAAPKQEQDLSGNHGVRSCLKGSKYAKGKKKGSIAFILNDVQSELTPTPGLDEFLKAHRGDLWWPSDCYDERRRKDANKVRENRNAQIFVRECAEGFDHLKRKVIKMYSKKSSVRISSDHLERYITDSFLRGAGKFRGLETEGMEARKDHATEVVKSIVDVWLDEKREVKKDRSTTGQADQNLAAFAEEASMTDRLWALVMAMTDTESVLEDEDN